jgi:hypothetical protein
MPVQPYESTVSVPAILEAKSDSSVQPAYLFTNEAQEPLFRTVRHANRIVLAVASGGDYILQATARGAKCRAVDISVFALLFTELKFAAVSRLSYGEFKDFFADDKQHVPDDKRTYKTFGNGPAPTRMFHPDTYATLRDKLTDTAQQFFDTIIERKTKDERGIVVPAAITYVQRFHSQDDFRFIPYLLNERNYLYVQELASIPPLHRGRIDDFLSPVDIVYTSNIHTKFSDELRKTALLKIRKKTGATVFYYAGGRNFRTPPVDESVIEVKDALVGTAARMFTSAFIIPGRSGRRGTIEPCGALHSQQLPLL